MALVTLAVGSACGALAQGAPATGELLAQNLRAPSLAETVVAATRTPQPLADLVADVSIVDRETIENSGATGLADLLVRLPGVEFSTRQPYPDARGLLDAGVRVALASDCNPGSCFTSSMALCIALAVREMRMSPAEALHAATAMGAAALDRDDVGVLAPGKAADLVLLDAPSYVHLAYRPGVPLVAGVWQAGRPVVHGSR